MTDVLDCHLSKLIIAGDLHSKVSCASYASTPPSSQHLNQFFPHRAGCFASQPIEVADWRLPESRCDANMGIKWMKAETTQKEIEVIVINNSDGAESRTKSSSTKFPKSTMPTDSH